MIQVPRKFSRDSFLSVSEQGREGMLTELAALLALQMQVFLYANDSEERRHYFVDKSIEELKVLGHELWGWDEDDERDVWGIDYMQSNQAGIIVEFVFPNKIEIWWRGLGPQDPQYLGSCP